MITIPESGVTSDEIRSRQMTHVDREASIFDASLLMRKSRVAELLVTGEVNGTLHPIGVLTADDIVTRVIAAGLDPAVLTAGDIAWCGMQAAPVDCGDGKRVRRSKKNHGEALAVTDGDGRLVGTLRRDEVMQIKPVQANVDSN
jgi:CBS domain-containing protein